MPNLVLSRVSSKYKYYCPLVLNYLGYDYAIYVPCKSGELSVSCTEEELLGSTFRYLRVERRRQNSRAFLREEILLPLTGEEIDYISASNDPIVVLLILLGITEIWSLGEYKRMTDILCRYPSDIAEALYWFQITTGILQPI